VNRRVLLIVLGGVVVFASVTFFIAHPWRLLPWIAGLGPQEPSPTKALNPPQQPKDQVQLLKEELDDYSRKVDDLQRLLTLLVGFSTIYAIALALSALKEATDTQNKLKDLRGQAEKSGNDSSEKLGKLLDEAQKSANESQKKLHDLRSEAEKIVQEARADAAKARDEILRMFPLFSGMSENFDDTLREMLRILPTVDKTDRGYKEPTASERERILFYEKTFSAAEYFNLKDFAPQVSKIYQGLGNFYGLSARTSRAESQEATPRLEKLRLNAVYKDQLARARFYLEKAIATDPRNTGALNDRAYLELTIAEGADQVIDDAEEYCRRSIDIDPYQQRARYNLGWLELTHRKNYAASVEGLGEAQNQPNWQEREPPRRIAEILYNKACALVRMGQESKLLDVRAKCLQEAMQDVEAAFARKDRDHDLLRTALCENDIKSPDGDLVSLRNDPAVGKQFEDLLRQICGQMSADK
jgi:Tfp pilus assembly protein PilF